MVFKKTVHLYGPAFTVSGYGVHTRLILDSLLDNDLYDVKLIPSRWGNTPNSKQYINKYKQYVLMHKPEVQPDIFIMVTVPDEMQRAGTLNILVSAITESDICSTEAILGANKADLVLVPSNFTKNILQNTRYEQTNPQTGEKTILQCSVPVEVLHEGINIDTFTKNPNYNFPLNIPESFAFLFVGTWVSGQMGEDRKDIGMLIKTFLTTFSGKKEAPALVLKTNYAGYSELERESIITNIQYIIDDVGKHKNRLPNVYLIFGELTDSEMNDLYNNPKVKCFVSFTKGEGYGLPLAEFSLTGKPIIVPNYSGYLDFLLPDYNLLLPGSLTTIHPSAANKWIHKDGKWFTVNYSVASSVLKNMYEKYDEFLIRSRKQPKHIRDNFSYKSMCDNFYKILDKYSKNWSKIVFPKITKI